jgi:hypothetical protein
MPQMKNNNREKTRSREQSGQGRVKDPENDGRLRENRERGVSKNKSR